MEHTAIRSADVRLNKTIPETRESAYPKVEGNSLVLWEAAFWQGQNGFTRKEAPSDQAFQFGNGHTQMFCVQTIILSCLPNWLLSMGGPGLIMCTQNLGRQQITAHRPVSTGIAAYKLKEGAHRQELTLVSCTPRMQTCPTRTQPPQACPGS